MGTQKDFFEIYRQFGHSPSKGFASPDLKYSLFMLSSILSYCVEYLGSKLCIHFREIFKDVVTIEKEIAKKKAEEIARKKEEERQKLLDIRCAEVCVMNSAEVELFVMNNTEIGM